MRAGAGTRPRRAVLPVILVSGVVAGLTDLTGAILVWGARGVAPLRLLQGIASGLLGAAAFRGGAATAAVGVVLHFTIAVSAAAVFALASQRLPTLVERPVLAGAAYGVAVYLFMSWIVLPLSLVQRSAPSWDRIATGIVIHVLCVGLPIALVTRWFALGAAEDR